MKCNTHSKRKDKQGYTDRTLHTHDFAAGMVPSTAEVTTAPVYLVRLVSLPNILTLYMTVEDTPAKCRAMHTGNTQQESSCAVGAKACCQGPLQHR